MAKLAISDLYSNGSHLLSSSENYIQELSEEELDIKGGAIHILIGLAVLLYATEAY
ncbi:MAG TPA: hypothetical protein VK203_07180 [Nostocaceae cyanobacterium]|nr:hypothetical protein [Nostocaceae cyanobacterium]